MATKTFYLTGDTASSSNHHALQDGGSAPNAARLTTGWIVGSSGTVPRYAVMDSGTERTAASSTGTAQPAAGPDNTLGDCFRSPTALTGTFASGNWSLSFLVQGETRATSAHDGKLRIRVYKSSNADGSSPTELTGSVQVTSAYTDLANSATQTVTATWAAGAITLSNEYLFIQVAHQIDANGSNASCDTHIAVGSASAITTTNFAFAQTLTLTPIDTAEAFPTNAAVAAPSRRALVSWAQVSMPASSTFPQTLVLTAIAPSEAFGTAVLVNNRLTPIAIDSLEAFGTAVISTGGPDIQETFEDVVGNWTTTQISSGTGAITRSSTQKQTGTYSASLFTTASGDVACIGRTFSDPYNTLALDNGRRRWQHAWVYVPSTTVSALTGTEYLDLGGFWESATPTNGWRLRVMEGGELYAVGKYPGPNTEKVFRIYGTIPTDQWFELELGLWSNDGPLGRSFAAIVDGDFYGWYTYGHLGTGTYDRVGIGITRTNSADDLTVYVDNWAVDNTTSDPAGTDNRPSTNSYTHDYTTLSGINNEIHYATWWDDARPDATYGFRSGYRVQGGATTERMPALDDGWAQITIKAIGTLPTPGSGDYYAPMIAFHKRIPIEHNLEIQVVGNYLHYDVWDGDFHSIASWQLPVASNGQRVPDNNDKIRVHWEETSTTNLRVIVDYYDASAAAWTFSVIDNTSDLSNWAGENFLDADHKSVSLTIDSTSYGISEEIVGILDTFPNGVAVPSIDSLEAFGSATFSPGALTLLPGAIDTGEAFGTAILLSWIQPAAIDSLEVFSTPTWEYGAVTILPGVTDSLEAFGTHTFSAGAVSLLPGSIDSLEVFGSPVFTAAAIALLPGPVESLEAFGLETAVQPGARLLSLDPLGSQEQFDLPVLQSGPVSLQVSSILPEESFVDPQVTAGARALQPGSTSSDEAFSTPLVAPGAFTLLPGGLDSLEDFGLASLSSALQVYPTSIDSQASVSAAILAAGPYTFAPAATTSLEDWGSPTLLAGSLALLVSTIPSAETIDVPSVSTGAVALLAEPILSEVGFGLAVLDPGSISILAGSTDSLEAWALPVLSAGTYTLLPSAVDSLEVFGLPQLAFTLITGSTTSNETWPAPVLSAGMRTLLLSSIDSQEAFGLASAYSGAGMLLPAPIFSEESFGQTVFSVGSISILVASLGSLEYWGDTNVSAGSVALQPDPIGPLESFETAALAFGTAALYPDPASSQEAFGSADLLTTSMLQPESISPQETWAVPIVSPGVLGVVPVGIGSTESVLEPFLSLLSAFVLPGYIPTAETWNNPDLLPGPTYLLPAFISSIENFDAPQFIYTVGIFSITSEELFGAPTFVAGPVVLLPFSIASGENWNTPQIGSTFLVLPLSIVEQENFTDPQLLAGAFVLLPDAISGVETFGIALLNNGSVILAPSAMLSAEAFGVTVLYSNLTQIDIALSVELIRSIAGSLDVQRNLSDQLAWTRTLEDSLEV